MNRRAFFQRLTVVGGSAAAVFVPTPVMPPVVNLPPGGVPLEDIEREAIAQAMRVARGNEARAAGLLSISPRVMNYKLKTLGLKRSR